MRGRKETAIVRVGCTPYVDAIFLAACMCVLLFGKSGDAVEIRLHATPGSPSRLQIGCRKSGDLAARAASNAFFSLNLLESPLAYTNR